MFRFSLSKVLTVRELATLQAREALAAAQSRAEDASLMLAEASRSRQAFVVGLETRREQGMAAWDWAATSRQHEALGRAETAAAGLLEQALAAVSATRQALKAALMREEALDKLRERQWEEFRDVERATDQATNDELAQMMRQVRKGVG